MIENQLLTGEIPDDFLEETFSENIDKFKK